MSILVAALLTACVTPRIPGPERPPAPDRYTQAASPDPSARADAANELTYDPNPAARDMLITLHMRDVDPTVRASAAAAMERRLDTSLDGVLAVSSQSDPDPTVRAAAAQAHQTLRAWRKRPGTAAAVSLLCPGCGHFYLGANEQGAAYLGATAVLVGGGIGLLVGEDVSLSGGATSTKVPIGILMAGIGQNVWFYSIFDAYRDARVARGDVGYRIPITRESLGELAAAPFRPSVLKSPWFWGGVPAMLATGITISYLVSRDESGITPPTIFDVDRVNFLGRRYSRGTGYALGNSYYAALFAAVGVGEEALFRGVIQTELEERWGLPGVAIASVIFGAVHVTNFKDARTAAFAIPTLSVLGAALGLAYRYTDHKLAVPVAMHFWYDLLLSAAAFAADPTNQPFVVNYVHPVF